MAESTVKDISEKTIVFLRHGESEWIHKNIYCGWYDSDISREGEREAEKAGHILKENGYVFDEVYTSVLRRAGKTVDILLDILKQPEIPVYKSWRLNSRHYGALTGLSKGESIRKYGEEQIKLWRRAYDIPPPEITKDNPYYKRIFEDPIYKGGPSEEEFPITESLQQAINRTLSYWNDIILPRVANGKRILVIGHMNSLRAIIKAIDRISDEKIMEYNIPTGVPFIYELNHDLKPIISLKFLGDADYIRKANETLTIPGRGFERPKRSKPSVLEVYDYLSKKMEPALAVVDSVEEQKVAGMKEIEEVARKIERSKPEKLEADVDEIKLKVEEIVEPKVDNIVAQEPDKLLNSKENILLQSEADKVVESKESKIVELKVDEKVEPKLEIQIKQDEIKDKQLEPRVDILIDLSVDETKEKVIEPKDKTSKVQEILAQPKEKTVNQLNILTDPKLQSASISVTSKNYQEAQEMLTTKGSVVGSYKEIDEKLSMVTSRMVPSQTTPLIIEKETKEKLPTKKEEMIEFEEKNRTQL